MAGWLTEAGWTIVVRNLRIGRSEVDIVARDPSGTLVLVEVRSRSGPALGMPEESVDRAKVVRLYAAAWRLLADGGLVKRGARPDEPQPFRVDLVTVVRGRNGEWQLRGHVRGLEPS